MNLRNILTLSLAATFLLSIPEVAKADESELCKVVRSNVTTVAVDYKRGEPIDPRIVAELKTQVDAVKGTPLCPSILLSQMDEVLNDLSKHEPSNA